MPTWAWVMLMIAGALAFLLLLFRVRFQFDWNGWTEWKGFLEFGVPGLMRRWNFPEAASEEGEETLPQSSETSASEAETQKESASKNAKRGPVLGSRTRLRRALFLFVTDGAVWRSLLAYSLRSLRRLFGLLDLEVTARVSHYNPATMGRIAGYWYAARPFLRTRRLELQFDFEKPRFSVELTARGGFTLMRALACAILIFFSFPWFRLSRRAWRSWNLSAPLRFSGWRKWVYTRISRIPRMEGIS